MQTNLPRLSARIWADEKIGLHVMMPVDMIKAIETVGESTVSSGSWGEDSYCELAGAVHFHVASPALISRI